MSQLEDFTAKAIRLQMETEAKHKFSYNREIYLKPRIIISFFTQEMPLFRVQRLEISNFVSSKRVLYSNSVVLKIVVSVSLKKV